MTAGERFGVTNSGYMYSTAGRIAGWDISAHELSKTHENADKD
jgi:hypothetical protein